MYELNIIEIVHEVIDALVLKPLRRRYTMWVRLWPTYDVLIYILKSSYSTQKQACHFQENLLLCIIMPSIRHCMPHHAAAFTDKRMHHSHRFLTDHSKYTSFPLFKKINSTSIIKYYHYHFITADTSVLLRI